MQEIRVYMEVVGNGDAFIIDAKQGTALAHQDNSLQRICSAFCDFNRRTVEKILRFCQRFWKNSCILNHNMV